MIARFLLVCLGGALGSGARYATSLWAANAIGTAFPFGTLIVNVLGSFLLGFLMQAIPVSSDLRLMLTTGVMGGFTTYSTFNYETTQYFREGAWAMGATNIAVTVIGCLVAGLLGLAIARMIFGR
jgi:CrcB protein